MSRRFRKNNRVNDPRIHDLDPAQGPAWRKNRRPAPKGFFKEGQSTGYSTGRDWPLSWTLGDSSPVASLRFFQTKKGGSLVMKS